MKLFLIYNHSALVYLRRSRFSEEFHYLRHCKSTSCFAERSPASSSRLKSWKDARHEVKYVASNSRNGKFVLEPGTVNKQERGKATAMKSKLVWGIFLVFCFALMSRRHTKFQRDHHGFSNSLEDFPVYAFFAPGAEELAL